MPATALLHLSRTTDFMLREIVRILVPAYRTSVSRWLADRVDDEERHVGTDDLFGDVDERIAQQQVAEDTTLVVRRRDVLGPLVRGQRLDERIHLGPHLLEARAVEDRIGPRVTLPSVELDLRG